MVFFKKAIQNFLLVLIFVSFFISALIFFILSSSISRVDPVCNEISPSIVPVCNVDEDVKFKIRNNANISFFFLINGEFEEDYFIGGLEEKTFFFKKDGLVKFEPFIYDNLTDSSSICIQRSEFVSTGGLSSC